MRAKVLIGLTAVLLVAHPVLAVDKGVRVFTGKPVKLDAALTAFVAGLRQALLSADKQNFTSIDTMFAAKVVTFQRSLDPLEPWNKADDIKADYLAAAADLLVERGELPEGSAIPDYRPDAAKQLLAILSKGTFSTMSQVPYMVCTPAAYKVSRAAVKTFASAHETDASSLRFFETDLDLKKLPTAAAASAGKVPAGTLLAFEYDRKLSDDWELLIGSNGVKGYRRIADAEQQHLSQMHVCFGKFKDGYKVTALFGYGL